MRYAFLFASVAFILCVISCKSVAIRFNVPVFFFDKVCFAQGQIRTKKEALVLATHEVAPKLFVIKSKYEARRSTYLVPHSLANDDNLKETKGSVDSIRHVQ